MPTQDLDAALTGARLVEEAGALLTLGEEPGRMVAHAFERLGQLVPYDLATVLLREGDSLRVAYAMGPLATPQLSEALIPVRGNLRLQNALKARSRPATFEEDDPGEVIGAPSRYSWPPDSTFMTSLIQTCGTSKRCEAWAT